MAPVSNIVIVCEEKNDFNLFLHYINLTIEWGFFRDSCVVGSAP